MKLKTPSLLVFMGFLVIATGCLSDLRTRTIKRSEPEQLEARGRELLLEAWKAQGFDRLKQHRVYHFKGHDQWRGMMGKMGNPWPESEIDVEMRYEIGTFDGQVEFLSGKRNAETAGLQSWQYYLQPAGSSPEFQKRAEPGIRFILAAYQYFIEALDRLKNAPLVAYAGERELDGKHYDLVMVTWTKFKPHAKEDQYLIYIERDTKRMDYLQYTLRDTYLPGSGMMYGTLKYSDYREVDGISIPFRQTIYFGGLKKKSHKYLHELTLSEFEWDAFDRDLLHPNPAIEPLGDDKPAAQASLK